MVAGELSDIADRSIWLRGTRYGARGEIGGVERVQVETYSVAYRFKTLAICGEGIRLMRRRSNPLRSKSKHPLPHRVALRGAMRPALSAPRECSTSATTADLTEALRSVSLAAADTNSLGVLFRWPYADTAAEAAAFTEHWRPCYDSRSMSSVVTSHSATFRTAASPAGEKDLT